MTVQLRGAACALLLLVPTVLLGCGGGGGGESPPFQFATSGDTTVLVTVTGPAGPLRGVAITIEDVESLAEFDADSAESAAPRHTWLRGLTDSQGQLEAVFSTPTAVRLVDVVAHLPGYRGPWTDTALRDALGHFAPSARVTRSLAEPLVLNLAMEELP